MLAKAMTDQPQVLLMMTAERLRLVSPARGSTCEAIRRRCGGLTTTLGNLTSSSCRYMYHGARADQDVDGANDSQAVEVQFW